MYGQFMYMFKSNEFVNGGEKQITGLEVEVKTYIVPYEYPNQTLKLCHSTDNEFNSNIQINLTNLNYSTLTTVKNDFTWTITGDGYTAIDFDTPFCYNGNDNLVLIWENRRNDFDTKHGYAECWFDNSAGESWYKYQDYTYPSDTSTGTVDSSYRPNIIFKY